MERITRRELNHRSGQVIDRVLATGEPVEVTSRGRGSVVIARKAPSAWVEWCEAGLVEPGSGRLDAAPVATSASTVAEILDDIGSDH